MPIWDWTRGRQEGCTSSGVSVRGSSGGGTLSTRLRRTTKEESGASKERHQVRQLSLFLFTWTLLTDESLVDLLPPARLDPNLSIRSQATLAQESLIATLSMEEPHPLLLGQHRVKQRRGPTSERPERRRGCLAATCASLSPTPPTFALRVTRLAFLRARGAHPNPPLGVPSEGICPSARCDENILRVKPNLGGVPHAKKNERVRKMGASMDHLESH